MLRDIIHGILSDYTGKSLTKKKVAEATQRIQATAPLPKATNEYVDEEGQKWTRVAIPSKNVEMLQEEKKEKEEEKTEATTIESEKGNKVIVSEPPQPEPAPKPKPKKPKVKAIVAFPTGFGPEQVVDGKLVEGNDVGAFGVVDERS
jgi:hypothetical protein